MTVSLSSNAGTISATDKLKSIIEESNFITKEQNKIIEKSNSLSTKQNKILIWLTIAIFGLTLINVILLVIETFYS